MNLIKNILIIVLLMMSFLILTSCVSNTTSSKFISVLSENFSSLIEQSNSTLIDIRTPAEFEEGHIKNAILLDYYNEDFREQLSMLDKNETYLIYCRSGHRSANTLKIMKELGFTLVYNLKFGINDWKSKGFLVVK